MEKNSTFFCTQTEYDHFLEILITLPCARHICKNCIPNRIFNCFKCGNHHDTNGLIVNEFLKSHIAHNFAKFYISTLNGKLKIKYLDSFTVILKYY